MPDVPEALRIDVRPGGEQVERPAEIDDRLDEQGVVALLLERLAVRGRAGPRVIDEDAHGT